MPSCSPGSTSEIPPLSAPLSPEKFNKWCSIVDADPVGDTPMVAIHSHPQFVASVLIDNLYPGDATKTFKVLTSVMRPFKLPLRDIIRPNFASEFGSLGEIDPVKVKTLRDIQNPYGSALDYEKLMRRLWTEIYKIRDKILKVIDCPPFIHEFLELRLKGVIVDNEVKILIIPLDELQKFSNPFLPARCIDDILGDGYNVVLDDNGTIKPYDKKLIWPNRDL